MDLIAFPFSGEPLKRGIRMGFLVRLTELYAVGEFLLDPPSGRQSCHASLLMPRFSLLLTVALFWCMPQVTCSTPLVPAIMVGDEFGI